MDLLPTPEARTALIARIKAILLEPKSEWPKIAAEPATIGGIYSSYVVYVAAVPVLCALIGALVFGYGFAGVTYRPSLFSALWSAVLQYGLQLGGVYVFALIIDALAPRFGGAKDRVSAFKLAAYAATASWLAGVFVLVPALGFLTILGLYSLYLLYTGAPVLMRIAADRALGFTASIIVVGIVIGILAGVLLAALTPHGGPAGGDELSGKVTLPGGVTVDLDQLDATAKRLEKMAEPAQSGDASSSEPAASGDATNPTAIQPDALKALLPDSLPGDFTRGDVSTSTGGAAGFSFGAAKAEYAKGEARITLSLTDMGAMGAIAALGSAFGVNATEETETSYSKVGQFDGRMTMEKFDRDTQDGSFGVIVGDRVLLEAEGAGASMGELKSAVEAVDLARVEALAK
ncbi:MAG: Yip1 family protein [Methyloceanibacter sp.]